jgi:hypothetical protein
MEYGLVISVGPKGNHAAHLHSLLLRSGDLVLDPLARDFPFELGEGQKNVEGQASHAGRGVERLGHRQLRSARFETENGL